MISRTWPMIVALTLAGCMVGPNYDGPPKVISHDDFKRSNQPETPPIATWWTGFDDAQLSALITASLEVNPTVKIAEAHVRQARAVLGGDEAKLMPDVSARAAYARIHLPQGLSQMFQSNENVNYYNAGFDATWELDLFGGQKRAVEAAHDQEQSAEFQLADVQVQLAAEVGQSYINLRDAQHRLDLQRQTIDIEQKMSDLTKQRYIQGTATAIDSVRAEQQLASSKAGIAPIQTQVDQYLDALSFLTAKEPGDLDLQLAASKPLPLPPRETDVGNPADLLKNRPDIRSAERMLAASTAEIGEAKAQEFPDVNLLGTLGWGGSRPNDIGRSNTLLGVVAPVLQWHFLDFGRVQAQLQTARDLAQKASELTRQKYAGGTASLIDYLDAERQRIEAEQSLAQGQAQFSNAYIALEKSLGLGWQHKT